MGLNILTLGSSKTYTKESLKGGGAIAGKNCTISSITPIDGGNRVTFSYTLDDGTAKNLDLDVMNGVDGSTPYIESTSNNWFINGIDTGIKAKGEKGDTGSGFKITRQYSSVSDMMSDTSPANDSEVIVIISEDIGTFYLRLSSYIDPNGQTDGYLPIGNAQDIGTIQGEPGQNGADGITPHIDTVTKHWMIGSHDTGIIAEGKNGQDGNDGVTPHIDPATKHWFIGDTDTGILAEGTNGKDGNSGKSSYETAVDNGFVGTETEWLESLKGQPGSDGTTPHIDSATNHWFVGMTDTDILAEGVNGSDGVTPHIGSNNHWFIGDTDTGVMAQGTDGADGKDGVDGADGRSITSITKDDNDNIIVTFSDGTSQNIGKLSVDISADFLTSNGFGNLRYYNGHFQYYDNTTSTWIDTSITPDNVYVMNMTPQPMKSIIGVYDVELGKYKLKWEEPNDTVIDGQVACVVDKIIIRRKLGSVPTSETDGDLVLEIKRKDFGTYKNEYFVDTALSPSDGEIFYYKAFPMSTTGFYNTNSANETDGIKCKNYNLYGFKLDQNESNPDSMITYLSDCDNKYYKSAKMNYTADSFDYGDWADVWFIKNLKPCMLKYDGTVDYELDKNDYTKKIDGTDSDIANASYGGNAMVGIPKVYWKIVNNGDNTANIYFSDKQIDDDFKCWSHINNNGNEIDYCYMPIYNGSNVNDKLRSLSDKTLIADQTADTEITYAKANNTGLDIIWFTELFNDRMLINLLLLLIGKSTNTQLIFGTGNNNSYVSFSNTGIKNTGTMNTKGLFWGNQDNVSGVKIFGMEHWWGNQWRRIGGWINNDEGIQKIKMTYGQSDGSTVDGYNLDGNGYITIGNSTPSGTSGGYISKMMITDNGLIPTIVSGSATTYYCDGLWFNNSQVNYALVGGTSNRTSRVGALCSALNAVSSATYWDVGAALSCKPLAKSS